MEENDVIASKAIQVYSLKNTAYLFKFPMHIISDHVRFLG